MKPFDEADTMELLAVVKAAHSPQETGDATVRFWMATLNYGGVTNLGDAIEAVVRHYATPGADPWIKPGDVIGNYRVLRHDRVKDIRDGQLTPDVPGWAHGSVHVDTWQARYMAVLDGMPIADAIRTIPVVGVIPPMPALEAPQ